MTLTAYIAQLLGLYLGLSGVLMIVREQAMMVLVPKFVDSPPFLYFIGSLRVLIGLFRLVDRGNIVHASDQQGVGVITQIQPIAVMFSAPEEELPRINSGLQSGPLPVTALTSDGKTELDKGTLELVDNQVATGTIRLKAKFDNVEAKLWPGLTVATQLQINTLKDVDAKWRMPRCRLGTAAAS